MAWIHPAAVEHRARLFTRHDAHRYMRPDAERRMSPEELRLEDPQAYERKYGGLPRRETSPAQPSALDIIRSDETLRLRAIALIRDAQRQIAEIKHALALRQKANFNPDQPRVPAGNPDGGQWTNSTGDVSSDNVPPGTVEAPNNESDIEFTSSRRRTRGHHYNPQAIFNKYPLPKETRRVFDDATTGPLRDHTSNLNDRLHRLYNLAVGEHFESFIQRNNIDVTRMTPLQAH